MSARRSAGDDVGTGAAALQPRRDGRRVRLLHAVSREERRRLPLEGGDIDRGRLAVAAVRHASSSTMTECAGSFSDTRLPLTVPSNFAGFTVSGASKVL